VITHETCDIVTKVAGPRDDFGVVTYTTTHTAGRCEMSPLYGSETVDPSVDQVHTRLRCFLPARTVITPAAQVVWRGTTFNVQGSIEKHVNRGRLHHLECIVEGVAG